MPITHHTGVFVPILHCLLIQLMQSLVICLNARVDVASNYYYFALLRKENQHVGAILGQFSVTVGSSI